MPSPVHASRVGSWLLVLQMSCAAAAGAPIAHVEHTNESTANQHGFNKIKMVAALSAANIVAPQLVAHVLQGVELAPAELGQLDSAERAELVGAMKAAEVLTIKTDDWLPQWCNLQDAILQRLGETE